MGITISILITSYLLGAIPFGLIISKIFYHTDIRTVGSGNPGATNVWRTFGKKPGIATLVLDATKGIVPVSLAHVYAPSNELLAVLAGLCAIIGHNWSVFLLGKGGKGVATSAGVFLALIPPQAGIAIATFCVFFFSTGHVSVGSIAAAIVLFASTFAIPTSGLIRLIIFLAAVMVLIKHIPNMKRLANGTEPKVKFRS